MKRTGLLVTVLAALCLLSGCQFRISKPLLKMMVSSFSKEHKFTCYADSCNNRIGIPYVENGTPAQVMDIYYAPANIRKNAVLVDIHGGFYIGGNRKNNRPFASVFLKEGYDVVLVEYRLNDGKLDVSDELADCAAALDYLTAHADELGLNKDCMFLTGDSAGGHLALYMAEGAQDPTLPIHPSIFKPQGVLLNCPAYDFAAFSNSDGFSESAMEWFLGPRYQDADWMKSMSPRTFMKSYTGPLFVSTCTKDFIRTQSLLIVEDCNALNRPVELVDIASEDKAVGHVHNVTNPDLPESREVNARMVAFLNRIILMKD